MRKTALVVQTILTDLGALVLSWLIFYFFRRYVLSELEPGTFFSLAFSSILISLFWVLVFAFSGLYRGVLRRSRIRDSATLVLAHLAGGMLLISALILDDANSSRVPTYIRTASTYLFLNLSVLLLVKTIWLSYLKRLLVSGKVGYKTILVGSEASAQEVYTEILTNNPHLGIQFQGFAHIDQANNHILAASLQHLGHFSSLPNIVKVLGIEQAIIATEPSEHALIEQVLNYLEDTPVRTFVLPDTYQILLGAVRVNHILGTPLIEVRRDLMPVWQQVLKRLIDILSALFVFVLFWPALVCIAIAVKFSSPGPVIFTQYRIGRGGKPFKILKFRSMYTDAEKHGPRLSSTRDPRITPFGMVMRRTRIDELPQFWNVFIGEMSLVGPRPERQYFIDQIMERAPHYKYLNRVRPGITSLGQVKFGYAENVDQMVRRLRYDIMYIENMSLSMDFRILAFTILIVLKGKGK
jgi:exopolysaccharide biosynthesis polyprenyl glycosylphosphotransferase